MVPFLSKASSTELSNSRNQKIHSSNCVLRPVFIVPHVERLECKGIINDKDWYVATVLHQVLFMFSVQINTPLWGEGEVLGRLL